MASGQNPWMSAKYDILEEQARNEGILQRAQADLVRAQTANEPMEARARSQSNLGAAASGFGSGRLSSANALQVPNLAQSEIASRNAQAGLARAQGSAALYPQGMATVPGVAATVGRNAQNGISPLSLGFSGIGSPITGLDLTTPAAGEEPFNRAPGSGFQEVLPAQQQQENAYKDGTTKVPGKGSGKVDTQQAMLAPGEAVLNKAAAEHLGRDTISLLNAIGRHKMGLAPEGENPESAPGNQPAQDGAPAGYAKGTAKVPAKGASKPAKATAKGAAPAPAPAAGGMSPGLMQALLSMGNHGAGMPGGGMSPMPMQMPMVAGQ